MCQKLCKLANSRQSYSKNKKGARFLNTVYLLFGNPGPPTVFCVTRGLCSYFMSMELLLSEIPVFENLVMVQQRQYKTPIPPVFTF